MIKDHNQKQEGAEKSTNLQAQSITVNQGISYRDAKEIANDVFKNNFLELSQTALAKAEARASELIDDFLNKIKNEKPEALNSVESPSMQYALFSAQKEYAKTGDKELSKILVDLLVERADKEERSLIQIVLDESIEVSSKITQPQFDVLSIVFLMKYTMNYEINNVETFKDYLRRYFIPISENLTEENSCYQHLEYSNCTSNLVGPKFEKRIRDNYAGVFQKGYTKEQITTNFGKYEEFKDLFIPCLNDESLIQINAMNTSSLKEKLESLKVPTGEQGIIQSMFSSNTMTEAEVLSIVNSVDPRIEKLTGVWNRKMNQVNLTSVGIALGRANIKRKTNIDIDLNIWIK